MGAITNQQFLPRSLLSEAQDVIKKKWTFQSMQSFPPKQKTIVTLFQVLFPTNRDVNEVYVKASILNQFYNTNILAISRLSKEIVNLNIDTDLQLGEISIVNKIASALSMFHCYSFASKYCAMHNPCAYPINDRIVRSYLAKVIAKGNLSNFEQYKGKQTSVNLEMRQDYAFYKKVYDAFMQQYSLTSLGYQGVDAYIWIACKEQKLLYNLDLFKLIK